MKFIIQALIETPDGLPLTVPVQTIERSCDRIEDVGLRLEEAKSILNGLQDRLVRQQLAQHLDARIQRDLRMPDHQGRHPQGAGTDEVVSLAR